MDESYIEGRFGIVMEEIRDALQGIKTSLETINQSLQSISTCIDFKNSVLRVNDISREP